ncbi:hypothetical protein NDU88_007488 [Pleurodeles waltl]|uniref:Uncharacterized protein n=1 Tax=Pleurodeles waltl TaxID=8319 RepID=A0AAV7SSF1_PLEWA|nr:hypothetical protein NDU88_007488 [Pleurodeles waltl]
MAVQSTPATTISHRRHQLHSPIRQSLQPQAKTGALGPAQQRRASPSKLQAPTKPMPVPPCPPSWQATSSFCPVSRPCSNAQPHSGSPATRQQVTQAGQAIHQHLAPRVSNQRRSSTLFLHHWHANGGHQRPAKVTQLTGGQARPPHGDSPPQAPRPPGATPSPPALTHATSAARAAVRSDRRGPCPPGEARPPANPPAPGTNKQLGAPHHRELQCPRCAHPPRPHRAAGPPLPIGKHCQPAPTEDRR